MAAWANAEFSIILCGQQVRDQLVDTNRAWDSVTATATTKNRNWEMRKRHPELRKMGGCNGYTQFDKELLILLFGHAERADECLKIKITVRIITHKRHIKEYKKVNCR